MGCWCRTHDEGKRYNLRGVIEQALDGLLAHRRGEARGGQGGGGDHGHVGQGRVQRAHALLLRDEARHAAVHLGQGGRGRGEGQGETNDWW
jgi:hypothetical protein